MRTPILVALVVATALSSPAVARSHREHHRHESHHHHHAKKHHDRHERDRHHRYRHHHYSGYNAPYSDWSYRRLPVGYRLRPAYYGSRYIMTDYGNYGLRRPGRNLRWVRYGPDMLLVDIRRGRVVDVVSGRFY